MAVAITRETGTTGAATTVAATATRPRILGITTAAAITDLRSTSASAITVVTMAVAIAGIAARMTIPGAATVPVPTTTGNVPMRMEPGITIDASFVLRGR